MNSLLDQIQRTYDAEILTIALVTRIHEIPEKVRTALTIASLNGVRWSGVD